MWKNKNCRKSILQQGVVLPWANIREKPHQDYVGDIVYEVVEAYERTVNNGETFNETRSGIRLGLVIGQCS